VKRRLSSKSKIPKEAEKENVDPLYSCNQCGSKFRASNAGPVSCIHCSSHYLTWENYDLWYASLDEDNLLLRAGHS